MPDATPVDAYVANLDPPELESARALAARLLDQGMGSVALIDEVLVPAQREVGNKWHRNEWTVAQEHAATAVTDSVLAALSLQRSTDPTVPGRLVTCCVEGESHTLPLRMFSDSLMATGHDVVFLGASKSATELVRILEDIHPIALLASCTIPTNLVGARRTIEAAHEAGIPVILGGRALGDTSARADNLGADAWAPNASTAAAIAGGWVDGPPVLALPRAVESELGELELPRLGLIDDCIAELIRDQPRLNAMTDAQLAHTREGIAYTVQICAAALVTHDPTVLDDFTLWLQKFLVHRGVPATTIAWSYKSIANVLGDGCPTATRLLTTSASRLSANAGAGQFL